MIRILVAVGAVLTSIGLALTFVGGEDDRSEPSATPTSAAASPAQSEPSTTTAPTSKPSPSPRTSSPSSQRASSTSSTSTSSTPTPARHDEGGVPEAAKHVKAAEPAVKVAARLVTTLARRDAPEGKWRHDAGQLMTTGGRAQLAGMKPKDLPFTKVTGRARLVLTNQPSTETTPIGVPTDEGIWLVMVTKEGDRWKALSFSPMGDDLGE